MPATTVTTITTAATPLMTAAADMLNTPMKRNNSTSMETVCKDLNLAIGGAVLLPLICTGGSTWKVVNDLLTEHQVLSRIVEVMMQQQFMRWRKSLKIKQRV